MDWSRPDEDYIKKCSQNAGKKIAPEVDQRDAYEKKDEEEVEEEEGVESDQGTSSKGVQPQNKSKRNNPALARNEQVPGVGPMEFSFAAAEQLMHAQHKDIYHANMTMYARDIETMLHAHYNDLPFGVKLWRAVGAGARHRPGDGLDNFMSRTGRLAKNPIARPCANHLLI